MRDRHTWESDISSWRYLKQGLITGAGRYSRIYPTASRYGKTRANNLKMLTENIDAENHIALFALLYALLDPTYFVKLWRSTRLAGCIAHTLIEGDYTCTVIFHYDYDSFSEPVNNLRSNVFESSILEPSKKESRNWMICSMDELSGTFSYDKLQGVRNIALQLRDKIPSEDAVKFDSTVRLFKRTFSQKTVDVSIVSDIPDTEMNPMTKTPPTTPTTPVMVDIALL